MRKLNKNIPLIKHSTTSNAKINYNIKKMQEELDNMSYQMIIYNNPKLSPNKLCDDSYNSLIKVMLNNKIKKTNSKEGERNKKIKSARK